MSDRKRKVLLLLRTPRVTRISESELTDRVIWSVKVLEKHLWMYYESGNDVSGAR